MTALRRLLASTLLLASCSLGSLALLGCGGQSLAAHWRDREIRVDGALDDWGGLQAPLGRPPARVGVANDGEALYLSLTSDDPAVTRALAFGFTLWLDPAGGKAQATGIRLLMAPPVRRGRWDLEPEPFPARLDGIELLGPQPATRRWVAPPGGDGVEVALAAQGASLVYELRLPLARAAAWGLGTRPGAVLGLGLETTRPSFGPPRREGGPDDGEPGGRGPRGGRGPGSDGPRGGGRRGSQPLELWVPVRLATAP